jgi:hypothetical protein
MRNRISARRSGTGAGLVGSSILIALALTFCSGGASAQDNAEYTFAALHPDFLKTRIVPAYAQSELATSPAAYDPDHGDFRARFVSPSGRPVTIVVKSPVVTKTYDVPAIAANQSVYDYLNAALYDSSGQPRTRTTIKFPTGKYNFDFPLYSNCTDPGSGQPNYVHWQLPSGAADLVIDGQGSTINFSDFCIGLNLPNVARVTLKNFTFAWPKIQIATVATVTRVGGNGNTGYTYDVKIAPPVTGTLPKMIAAATSWDRVADHWDLERPNDDISYGDGVTSGVPRNCAETPKEQKTAGCTVRNVPSYGVALTVGESLLLRYYSFSTAISISGNDITLDHVTMENLVGSDFQYDQGRGLHVTHLLLTRMAGQPISAGGGGSLLTNLGGDVVIDHSWIGYQSDDAFDMNTTIMRYTPSAVVNDTPMNTFVFDAAQPARLTWPSFNIAQPGDVIGLFDNALGFQGADTLQAVAPPGDGATTSLTLNRNVDAALRKAGFIAGDLTTSAGARYLISDNDFVFNRARALLLQTPYGWVDNNRFVGQTLKEVYVLASQYWGEGAGAQELIISNNAFDGALHAPTFYALDVMAEAANFPNGQNEVVGAAGAPAPPINQNIVVAGNSFTADLPVNLVNLSSANNILFDGNVFFDGAEGGEFPSFDTGAESGGGSGQRPVSVHDASNIYFASSNRFGWLGESCAGSQLLALSSPPPAVSPITPVACGIRATVSNLIYARHRGISPDR